MPRMFRGYRYFLPIRRFGYGLSGGLLGTLILGGLGYILGRNSAYRGQYQSYQGIPTTGMGDDVNERMRTLNDLHDRGVLTDAEFETEKYRILYR